MPSSIGHTIAGAAVAWLIDLIPGDRQWRIAPRGPAWYAQAGGGVTVTCIALAAAPDLDLLFHTHRTATHSLSAALAVGGVAALMARLFRRPVARLAIMCLAAYGSHMALDWMAVDRIVPYGIQLLWPFDERWTISGWNVFAQTERHRLTTLVVLRQNAAAVAREIAILLPVAVVVWRVRVKALAGLSTKLPGGDHSSQ